MIIALLLAQTIFYFVVSLAIIVVGILCAVVAYHLIHIAKELEVLSQNLTDASSDAIEQVNDVIDRLSALPILSYFLRRRAPKNGASRRYEEKGRTHKHIQHEEK